MNARRSAQRAARTYGEGTRDLVLAAAEALFARRGLHNVSMQDIADEANVSRGTVFNQFGSKQLVLDAITARSLRAYRDLLKAALADDNTGTPEQLRRLFRAMGKGIEANRALYREVFAEIRKVSMGLDGEGDSPRLKKESFDILVAIIARGQKRGELSARTKAAVLATAFDSLLSGATIQWLHQPRRGALAALLSSLLDVLFAGILTRR